jgi:two-component system sensor histidine kinase HydH
MRMDIRKKIHLATYVPPWMILGSVVILLVVVALLAVRNINREKRYMSQILSEKGDALIKSFEAGARTGMMGMMWGGNQVQSLLEETARQPGILYLTVTDKEGLIMAHSDRAKIGKRLMDSRSIKALGPAIKEQWRVTESPQSGRRSFEVYRYFRPLVSPDVPARRRMMRGMMGRQNDWCFPRGRQGMGRSYLLAWMSNLLKLLAWRTSAIPSLSLRSY